MLKPDVSVEDLKAVEVIGFVCFSCSYRRKYHEISFFENRLRLISSTRIRMVSFARTNWQGEYSTEYSLAQYIPKDCQRVELPIEICSFTQSYTVAPFVLRPISSDKELYSSARLTAQAGGCPPRRRLRQDRRRPRHPPDGPQ